MAGSAEGDMSGSWWGGWLQAAKEKSSAALEVVEMVRKDLAEFSCTMQNDTGHAVEVTSSTLKESLKTENTSAAKEKLTKGLNTFLEGISKALVVPPDDEGQIPITAPSSDLYDRAKARLHAVQVDPDTYLYEPGGSTDAYSKWCESFDLDCKKGEISELLVTEVEVRGLYTKLVPSRVSHVEFWRRYFYKLHQIDLDQARKEALMKRAETSKAEDSISWDDDWSGDEAAEDSGSDWEKLPRPNQEQSAKPPSASAAVVATESQARDTEERIHSEEESTRAFHPAGERLPGVGFQDINLEEEKENPLRGEVPELTEKSSETPITQPQIEKLSLSNSQETCDSFSPQMETDTPKKQLKTSEEDDAGAVKSCEPVDLGTKLNATSSEPESVSTVSELASIVDEVEEKPPKHSSQTEQQQQSSARQEKPASGDEHICTETESVEVKREQDGFSQEDAELKTTERGDLVVVGSDHGSPVSNSSLSKVASEIEDDWDEDLDLELTEEDMKAAEELAKKMGENINLEEDDWENWE